MNKLWTKSIAHFSEFFHQSNHDSSILALCKLGRLREALQSLRTDSAPSPSSTYSTILQLCIDYGMEEHGRSLHDHLLALRYQLDLHLSTKFVIFYSKAGDVSTARRIFDEMPRRTLVSWTAMISGYSQNGYPEEALKMFSLMHLSGFKANQFTYGSILRACTGVGCIKSGDQIHGCVVKSRFAEDLFVQSALMDMHLKCGSFEDAWCLFRRMERRDVVSWNSLIGGCAIRGLGNDAFGLFCLMLKEGPPPDHFTFASILRACGTSKALVHVDLVLAFILKLGYGAESVVAGSLIDAYAKCRSMRNASMLYYSMREPDLISSTALINGYSMERDCSKKAMELFCTINRTNMRIDNVILCSVLNKCANVASLNLGRQIHARTFKNQSNYDVAVGNALIDMYGKSGELQDAHHAFDEMPNKNVISWTSLITAYGKHGVGDSAVTLFVRMEDDGVKPNDVTFLSLLAACSHSGLTNKGMEYLNSMVSRYGIHPRAEHYSCVVDLLARGGMLEEAYKLVCKMDVQTNTSLWGAMLGACRTYGYDSLGKVAAGHLFSLDPGRSVNYIVLANIYAAAGFWDEAWKIRTLMIQNSTKKDAGYSII
ncbi:pentatricopeptide repeat-containing protein At3g20730 [Typha angustifolia]|uniref:pentatricopeptide repeat-containing protein At3g20730 n=1 Tax=Typha angustifolia TaxID=59011 RepID=UPI003C2EE4EA